MAQGHGDRASPLQSRAQTVCQERETSLLLWDLALRQEGRCRINSRVKSREQKLLQLSSSDKASPGGFPVDWGLCSHPVALDQQGEVGAGAGVQLLGFPGDARFPKPSGAGTPSSARLASGTAQHPWVHPRAAREGICG